MTKKIFVRSCFYFFFILCSFPSFSQDTNTTGSFAAIASEPTITPEMSARFSNSKRLRVPTRDIAAYLSARPAKKNLILSLTDQLTFELELEDAGIIAHNYSLQLLTEAGKEQIVSTHDFLYKGKIKGIPHSAVRLAIKEHFIYGSIQTNEKEYFIEPLSRYDQKANKDDCILYEGKDLIAGAPLSCGVTDPISLGAEARRQVDTKEFYREQGGDCRKVKFVMVGDYSIYQKFGYDYQKVADAFLANLNVAQGAYTQFNFGTDPANDVGEDIVQFEAVQITISTCRVCDPVDSSNQMYYINNAFAKWIPDNTQPDGFTINQFWTTRPLYNGGTNGVLGIVGSITWPCASLEMAFLRYYTDDVPSLRLLVAHETGHNLGAYHDDFFNPAIRNFIMYSHGGPGNTQFSTLKDFAPLYYSSQQIMRDTIARRKSCLSDCIASGCPPVENAWYDYSPAGDLVLHWKNGANVRVRYKRQQDSLFRPADEQYSTNGQATIPNLEPCAVYLVELQSVCTSGQLGPATTLNLGSSQLQLQPLLSPVRDSTFDLRVDLQCLHCNTADYRVTLDHLPVALSAPNNSRQLLLSNLLADGALHRLDLYKSDARNTCSGNLFFRAPYYRATAKVLALADFNDCQFPAGWKQEVVRSVTPATDQVKFIVTPLGMTSDLKVAGSIDSTCMLYYDNAYANTYPSVAIYSPEMDLTGFHQVYLSFDYKQLSYKGALTPFIHVEVFNGNQWTLLSELTSDEILYRITFNRRLWDTIPRRKFFSLDKFRSPRSQVRLVVDDLTYVDNAGVKRAGNLLAAFDNIRIDGYADTHEPLDFSVFPNPADKAITIRFNQYTTGVYEYRLLDTGGRMVGHGILEHFIIPLERLTHGVYLLQLYLPNGTLIGTKKVIKNN